MFGFGDKNKVHKVTIANTGETFEVEGKINLLIRFIILRPQTISLLNL